MTSEEFSAALASLRPRKGSEVAVEGARLVLVEGLTQYRAAKDLRISAAAISRLLARLRNRCPTCGHPL